MSNVLLLGLVSLAAVAAFLWFFQRGRGTGDADGGVRVNRIGDGLHRLEANMRQYAHMTPALLEQTADDTLLEAVLSNLWAKMQPDLSDAEGVMAGQTDARRAVYALYWVTGEAKQNGFAGLRKPPGTAWFPVALDALDALDMRQSAAMLRAAMEAPDADACRDAYLEAFHAERGKERMAAFIRSEPEAFVDGI